MAEHEFDVVIVGGGSAGCAAAGRLCATTDLHVCLVEAAGFPRLPDLSAPDPPQAVAPFHANVLDHTRWNSAFAFLDPVRELPTLTVYDGTTADRLLFDQENATALICSGGAEVELVARMFILAAGVYGSPAILMRSGIGPSGHLTELGIFAATDSPGVGENLHDQPGVAMRFGPSPGARRAVIEEYRRGALLQGQVNLGGPSGEGN